MNAQKTRTYKVFDISCGGDWRKNAEEAAVDNFPWSGEGAFNYRPLTRARVAADPSSLFVFMETDETELRAETNGFGFVHTDSCMEFFLAPDPDNTSLYLNWEFNPLGGMYLSIGKSRRGRVETREENYRDLFEVKTSVHSAGWNLEFRIPLEFLRRYFPSLELKAAHTMRGNFYKCGDKTVHPHYGCWSPIELPKPDFHSPQFFGVITL